MVGKQEAHLHNLPTGHRWACSLISSSAASGPSSAWSTYLRYLIARVEQESVINIDKLEAPNVWAQCDQTSERTLIDCHPIPATAIDSDRPTLLYGWPTVSIPTKRGRRVRFPLLVVTVRRSEEMFVVEDADIRINPALLGDLLEPEITEVIRQLPTTLEGQAWVASNLDESYVHTLGNKPQDWLRKISRPFWPSSGFLEEPPVR